VDALLTESLCPQEACIVLQADAQAPFDSTALEDLVVRTWPAPVILIAPRPKLEWAIETVRGGVHTVVEEPVEREHLQRCIAGALQACRARLQQQMERKQERARFDKLTPREMEVTSMLLQGLNSREIARELKLSVKTVEVHRNHIRQKTAVRTFPELVLLAQRCGISDGHGNASDSWNARPP
jgi:FixJ family two-component response regulator